MLLRRLHAWPLSGSVACIVAAAVIGEVEGHHIGEQRTVLLLFGLQDIQMMSRPIRAHQTRPILVLI